MAANMARKCFFGPKKMTDDCRYPGSKKFNIAFSCTVSEINAFLYFTQKFQMAAKNGGERFLEKNGQMTLWIHIW